MQDNPITGLLGLMGRGTEKPVAAAVEGIILSTGPMRVQASGIELEPEDLLINAMLLEKCESENQCYDNKLQAGDRVLLVPSGDLQKYYIACKLVEV